MELRYERYNKYYDINSRKFAFYRRWRDGLPFGVFWKTDSPFGVYKKRSFALWFWTLHKTIENDSEGIKIKY